MNLNSIKKSSTVRAVKIALDFEVKGAELYLSLARKTENALAKKLFYTLARQEVEHAEKFDEIYNQLRQNNGWKNIEINPIPVIENNIKTYFKNANKATFRKKKVNLSGYKMAMEMENVSYAAYKALYEKAKDNIEKQFFAQLMKEENEHYEAIQNVYHYLAVPGDWLQEDESHRWNWMNI